MSIAVINRFRELERIVSIAQSKGLDPEIASYHSKLGCILICGAIERSVEVIIVERICNRSAPQIKPFLRSFFKRGTNYDCDEILKLLHRFDNNWGSEFKKFLDENDKVKNGIGSCYAVRNSIAHGGTLSLGPAILKQYFDDDFTLIAELESIVSK